VPLNLPLSLPLCMSLCMSSNCFYGKNFYLVNEALNERECGRKCGLKCINDIIKLNGDFTLWELLFIKCVNISGVKETHIEDGIGNESGHIPARKV